MTCGTAAAADSGATGRYRSRGGAQVPDALGKALQGRALGLLTLLVPGFAFSGKAPHAARSARQAPTRSCRPGVTGTSEVPLRRSLPLTPVQDDSDGSPCHRPDVPAGVAVTRHGRLSLACPGLCWCRCSVPSPATHGIDLMGRLLISPEHRQRWADLAAVGPVPKLIII